MTGEAAAHVPFLQSTAACSCAREAGAGSGVALASTPAAGCAPVPAVQILSGVAVGLLGKDGVGMYVFV